MLYDVRFYPAATPNDEAAGESEQWLPADDMGPFFLCPFYEYPDDAESADDISWFVLVAKSASTNAIYEVINDETA